MPYYRDTESIKRRLMSKYGFSSFFARSFAWSIIKGEWKEFGYKKSAPTFRELKESRRKHVLEHYKALGGRYLHPDFTKSAKGLEAIRRADSQIEDGGWAMDKADTYIQYYYRGFKTPEAMEEFKLYALALEKQLKKEGLVINVPKH